MPPILSLRSLLSTFLGVFIIFLSQTDKINGQEPCNAPSIDQATFDAYISDLQAIEEFSFQRSGMTPGVVPVLFHVILPSDGSGGTVSPANADAFINDLNQLYAPANLSFVRIGFINEIHCNTLSNNKDFASNYTFLPNVLNVFVHKNFAASATAFSPLPLSAMAVFSPVTLAGLKHEVGHIFSLLHTFGSTTYGYHYPAEIGQYDYPDPAFNSSKDRRELVIRPSTDPIVLAYYQTKTFTLWNCENSGDLCCDTEADCNSSATGYPDPDPINLSTCETTPLNCISGCQTNNNIYTGTYRDYNFDPINPQLDNVMGAHSQIALTPCQYDRVAFNYETYRKNQLLDGDINYNDYVLCENNTFGVKNVVIRTTHTTDARYSISTTRPNGSFQGHLFDTKVKANVRKIGSTFTTATPSQPATDAYTTGDWLEGVSTFDLLAMAKHILNIEYLPNGYKKLAADINQNSLITTYDIVELRKLILGIYTSLPNAIQPWRFIPDFIPENFGTEFDTNPFSVNLGSGFVSANTYTSPNWEYDVSGLSTGSKGYRGVKIGNVDGPCVSTDPPSLTTIDGTSAFLFESGKDYELSFNINNFQDIIAFQLGLKINPELFDVISINLGDLTSDFTIEDNVGSTKLNEGILKLLWLDPNLVSKNMANGNSLIKLIVHAKQTAFASENAYNLLNSETFASIFLGSQEQKFNVSLSAAATEIQPVTGRENTQKQTNASSNIGISPNPFNTAFTLRFFAENESDGQILVRSVTTGEANLSNVHFSKGANALEVLPETNTPGLYSIELFDGNAWHFLKAIKI